MHGDSTYTVTGMLAPSGSVLDRLIMTDTASVWKVHEDYTAVVHFNGRYRAGIWVNSNSALGTLQMFWSVSCLAF